MSNLTFQFLSATGLVAFVVALTLAIRRREIAPLAAINLGVAAIVLFYLASRFAYAIYDSGQIALGLFALLTIATSLAEFLGRRVPRTLIVLQFVVFAIAVIGAVLIAFTFRITRLI